MDMNWQPDCIFCKFASGEIVPDGKIYDEDGVYVFLSKSPINPGHALVIPKAHYPQVYELPDDVVQKMALVLVKFSKVIKEAMKADGINIHMNNEKGAGQEVFHAHFHIIPRFLKDGYANWEPKMHGYKEGEANELAQKIRATLSTQVG